MKKSILDVAVSCFRSVHDTKTPVTINLLTWLQSAKYRSDVLRIRQTPQKEKRTQLKKQLPCITPSGVFTQRKAAALQQHSGLLAFDIDYGDNTHIKNLDALGAQIRHIRHVAYVGLSVSGNGWWGLVPIARPEQHTAHFKALQQDFATVGIQIDEACKDICRLRFYSYDPDAYFNHQAETYTNLHSKVPPIGPTKPYYTRATISEAEKVESCIQQLEQSGIDITTAYADWRNIAIALYVEFGSSGRTYFHRVSALHSNYDSTQTDKLYDDVIQYDYTGCTIGTFYRLCQGKKVFYRNDTSSDVSASFEPTHHQALQQLRTFFLTQDIPFSLYTTALRIDNLHQVILTYLKTAEASTDPTKRSKALTALAFIRGHLEVTTSH